MYVVYCDGSSKKTNNVVVGIVVVKLSLQYKTITNIIYCYKNSYNINPKENMHEIVAHLESLKVIKELGFEKELVIIVNDSIADNIIMNDMKKDKVQFSNKITNTHVINLWKVVENIDLGNIYFQRFPRTNLGINIADFLNKEEDKWVADSDKKYLSAQLKKLNHRPWDYDISSKTKELKRKL